jgi:hypothetical protein
MAFASVATLFERDTLTALTVSGFSISLKAIFDKEANMKALQTLLSA